jgi:prolipoprotein diacylglyceryltransferase
MVIVAALISAALVLRLARQDGADLQAEARTLALVYLGALLGGYALEFLRAVPAAVRAGSLQPCLHVGRAAYGGLLCAIALALCYRLWRGLPVAAFFDRAMLGCGVSFLAVRVGCFLSGCDYGVPTASLLGVRFPAGSLAAIDHAARGFVPMGRPSLPVHPTQLYEALLGGVAALVAAQRRRGGRRDGSAFLLWVSLYAAGRFLLEFLRGDVTRGLYLGLSSAQYISLAVGGLVALVLLQRDRRRLAAAAPHTERTFPASQGG